MNKKKYQEILSHLTGQNTPRSDQTDIYKDFFLFENNKLGINPGMREVIIDNDDIINNILETIKKKDSRGIINVKRNIELIFEEYWWPTLVEDISRYVVELDNELKEQKE